MQCISVYVYTGHCACASLATHSYRYTVSISMLVTRIYKFFPSKNAERVERSFHFKKCGSLHFVVLCAVGAQLWGSPDHALKSTWSRYPNSSQYIPSCSLMPISGWGITPGHLVPVSPEICLKLFYVLAYSVNVISRILNKKRIIVFIVILLSIKNKKLSYYYFISLYCLLQEINGK